MHRRTTGVTGPEELHPGRLTCSLVIPPVPAPVPQLGTTGSTGASRLWLGIMALCSGDTAPVYPELTGWTGAQSPVQPVPLNPVELI